VDAIGAQERGARGGGVAVLCVVVHAVEILCGELYTQCAGQREVSYQVQSQLLDSMCQPL
jgi:hypothetical protein